MVSVLAFGVIILLPGRLGWRFCDYFGSPLGCLFCDLVSWCVVRYGQRVDFLAP